GRQSFSACGLSLVPARARHFSIYRKSLGKSARHPAGQMPLPGERKPHRNQIVARSSEYPAIAGKTDRRVGWAIFCKAHHKLCCKMGRISGAAAIAADEQFVSSAQRFLDQIRSLRDLRVEIEKRLKRLVRRNDCPL